MPVPYAFSLACPDGAVIRGDLHVAPGERAARSRAIVVFVHGFKGFKDWGFFPYLSEAVAARGGAAVRFNFSLNGVGPDLLTFTELDRFRENTLRREVEDLDRVLDALRSGAIPLPGGHLPTSFVLVGHSRGGAAVLDAARRAPLNGVKAALLLASVSRYPLVTPDEAAEWRRQGVRYVENVRTKQLLPCGLGLLDELDKDPGAIERNARSIGIPVTIVHGTADTSVPPSSADQLEGWIRGSKKILLEGADHAFNAGHPFPGPSPALERIISAIDEAVAAA